MLGKKLYALITELDTSERKLLFNKSYRSEDKRIKQLAVLLGKKNQSIEDFQNNLQVVQQNIVPKNSSDKNKADAIRRFTDFAAGEIENMKITNHIKANSALRSYVLSEIYKETDLHSLQEEYVEKLNTSNKSRNDFWFKDYYLVQKSVHKLRSQTSKDLEDWKKLLLEQKQLTHDFYLSKTSNIYDKISAAYLDDKSTLNVLGKDFASEEGILDLINETSIPAVKALFYLSLAQFNFEHNEKFKLYSSLCLSCLTGAADKNADMIRRKMFFVNFLHGFHYGFSSSYILDAIESALEIDLKYKQVEERTMFFLFFSQIIFNIKKGKINYFNHDSSKYFQAKSSDYFYKFLKAFECFTNGEIKQAKSILMNVSYTKNPYIASWSRQLEIVINLKQGNDDLVSSYFVSETKKVLSNSNRVFAINSSAKLLSEVANLSSHKVPVLLSKLYGADDVITPFHRCLMEYIKN